MFAAWTQLRLWIPDLVPTWDQPGLGLAKISLGPVRGQPDSTTYKFVSHMDSPIRVFFQIICVW